MSRSAARGYRSLMVRGLLTVDGAPDRNVQEIVVPLSLLGLSPGITGTWVTNALTQVDGVERFELFANITDQFVAVTTRPGGIHTFAVVSGQDAVRFFAEMAVGHQANPPQEDARFCLLIRGVKGDLVGGYVIGETVLGLGPDAAGEFGPTGLADISPTVEAWRARILELLTVETAGLPA